MGAVGSKPNERRGNPLNLPMTSRQLFFRLFALYLLQIQFLLSAIPYQGKPHWNPLHQFEKP
jgi:hypothetical protein